MVNTTRQKKESKNPICNGLNWHLAKESRPAPNALRRCQKAGCSTTVVFTLGVGKTGVQFPTARKLNGLTSFSSYFIFKLDMAKLSSQDIKKVNYFRNLFPHTIKVKVSLSNEGGFCVEVLTFPGCLTQAETFSELIEMVNDAVATILQVPRKYLPYMPTYMPPVTLAQRLNIFPSLKVLNKSVTFSIQ